MDEQKEQNRRRKAMRLWVNQIKRGEILQRVNRSRSWFKKWQKRFEVEGWRGLRSQSRAPKQHARAYPEEVRQRVVQARHRLARRKGHLR
jgi:putative transposase